MSDTEVRSTRHDITRTTLTVLFIAVFLLGSFWVIQPFLFAFLWATLIVIPTWPVMLHVCDRLGGRRGLTVALIVVLLLLLVVLPLWFAFGAIVEYRHVLAGWIETLSEHGIPPPPPWLEGVPLIGGRLHGRWLEISATSGEDLMGQVSPYLQSLLSWFVSQIGGAGLLFVHFLLTVVLTALLFMRGEAFAEGVRRFAERLGGERGLQATMLAAQAIKAVAMGVVVTALVQSGLAALALWIVGIPYPIMLAAIIFFLAVIQVGAAPVLLPSLGWLFWSGQVTWGIILLVFSILIMGVDNVLRPVLIKRGADLPLVLIFAGVIGGLIAFGIIGLFIGPIILAVSYTLLTAWVNELPLPSEQQAAQ